MTMRASALDVFGSRLRNWWHRHMFPRSRGPRRKVWWPHYAGNPWMSHFLHAIRFRTCLKRKKNDPAKTSQTVPGHVATAKHTVQEWVQDPVEKDPLQLCVIPQNELTGDTVRIVFANCSMATWSARLHAKTALCAALAFGRSLLVVPSGCVGARWFEDTTRMSMAVVVRKALCVHAGGAWGL